MSEPRISLGGGRFGTLIGCTAWVVMLAVLCLAQGRFELLLSVVLPLLLASWGVAVLVLMPIEVLYAPSRVEPERLRVPMVLGATALACGLLLLLANAVLVPELANDEALAGSIRSTGGVLSFPRWVPTLMLLIGAVTMTVVQRRVAKGEYGQRAG